MEKIILLIIAVTILVLIFINQNIETDYMITTVAYVNNDVTKPYYSRHMFIEHGLAHGFRNRDLQLIEAQEEARHQNSTVIVIGVYKNKTYLLGKSKSDNMLENPNEFYLKLLQNEAATRKIQKAKSKKSRPGPKLMT